MVNIQELIAAIQQTIKTNGNKEITGQVLQDILISIINMFQRDVNQIDTYVNDSISGQNQFINDSISEQNQIISAVENSVAITKIVARFITSAETFTNQNVNWNRGTYFTISGEVANVSTYSSATIDVSDKIGQSVFLVCYCAVVGYCGFKDSNNVVINAFQTVGNDNNGNGIVKVVMVNIPEDAETMFISNRHASMDEPIISISNSVNFMLRGNISQFVDMKFNNGFKEVQVDIPEFVQGTIAIDGLESSSGENYFLNRVRTVNYYLGTGNVSKIFCAQDFNYRLFAYNQDKSFDNYLGDFTGNNIHFFENDKYYRIVIRKRDDSNISVAAARKSNLRFYGDGLVAIQGELIKVFDTVNTSTKNNLLGKRVAFLGDSITYGLSASSQEKTYHGVFCSLYGAIDRTTELYNSRGPSTNLLGIAGTCIAANTKNNLGAQRFITRVTAENFSDSKLIIIFGGTNDLSYDRKPIGELFIEQTIQATGNMGTKRIIAPTDTETFAGALHELITAVQSTCPGIPIVLMTPIKRDHHTVSNPDYLTCNSNGDFMIDYVNAIKKIGAFYSLPVLDLYSNSQLNPLSPGWSSMFSDGLHPNDAGHRLIGNLLFKFVEENVIIE